MTASDRFNKQPIFNIADMCAQHGVENVIISPGSRSAPLTVAFARQPKLRCRVAMDERAAGFIALGLAQQTQTPVGLVCTSGTAGLNYAPAVTEAFYQRIPLLVFTADRPPEWIDQQDGQTIHQTNLYGSHLRGSYQLPLDYSHPDALWHLGRLISEAINTARWPVPGPVQINVPLREPLYPPADLAVKPQAGGKIIRRQPAQAVLSAGEWRELESVWQSAGRKLILGGLYPSDEPLSEALISLQQDRSVALLADLTANLHQSAMSLHHWDMALGAKSEAILETLAPDLVVSFGGQIVSKYLKQFLRKHRPTEHWYIDPAGQHIDTFQSLTRIIPARPAYFFTHLAERSFSGSAAYSICWQTQEAVAQKALDAFLADVPFGEFRAVYDVMQALPAPSHLQLSNSMPVRYANFIGLPGQPIQVNANRGASGIDGVVSTTVGAALATHKLTTLITGDLAFFYDRNALWHNHVPPNLRIIILNNHGGGIFNLIDGPGNLPAEELTTYFETPHPLTARNTAADHGCAYFHCAAAGQLQAHLPAFFNPNLGPNLGPAILEIETDGAVNTEVFRQFKEILA